MTQVGRLIETSLHEVGMSGRTLARRVGCSESAIRQLISGTQRSGHFRGRRSIGGSVPLILRVQRVLEIPGRSLRDAMEVDDRSSRRALLKAAPRRRVTDPLVLQHRTAILRAARRNGARDIRLFGSRARGDARADSDVDLLVAFEEGRSLLDLSGLVLDLREILDRNVDVATERGLRPALRARVLREAVPL